jgi:hypothetical protein
MSPEVGSDIPVLLPAFLVWRVAYQSFASGTSFTTRRGKVSMAFSRMIEVNRRLHYNALVPRLRQVEPL